MGKGLGEGYALSQFLKQIAFKTPAPALTAQVNCAYAYAAASHADAWLAEHFQKQNALKVFIKREVVLGALFGRQGGHALQLQEGQGAGLEQGTQGVQVFDPCARFRGLP